MSITLPAKWIEHLTQLPESGMGWQRVDVELADGRRLENCLVRNAELMETPEPVSPAEIRAISIHPPCPR
jgi:hypothetical protein